MIVGAPTAHFVGDPVDTGSLSRTTFNFSSSIVFGQINTDLLGMQSIIKDGTLLYADVVSPLASADVSQNPTARYIYPLDIFNNGIDSLLKDASGGLQLNRITSENGGASNFDWRNYGSRMGLPYFRCGQVGYTKEVQYQFGRVPNGN